MIGQTIVAVVTALNMATGQPVKTFTTPTPYETVAQCQKEANQFIKDNPSVIVFEENGVTYLVKIECEVGE